MTRGKKINKLAGSIWEYRGKWNPDTRKWRTPPNPKAIDRVIRWLEELKLPVAISLVQIDEFKHGDDFRNWLLTIPTGEPEYGRGGTQ